MCTFGWLVVVFMEMRSYFQPGLIHPDVQTVQISEYRSSYGQSLILCKIARMAGQENRNKSGHGSRVFKVSDSCWSCHEFESSTTKVPPCRGAMNVGSVESSIIFPLVCCGN
ncbi:hypothetical protein TNCV_4607671 [Trichonephila clavipes]|nr:hypothetical protein TNCV_4607671 [Trichonephila clavipes]